MNDHTTKVALAWLQTPYVGQISRGALSAQPCESYSYASYVTRPGRVQLGGHKQKTTRFIY
ncbi:hypothetical protein T265_02138 [Opisthorchis viverrini]|uniref:Uncharacterized protein n=1 Tax=Opisthorchis viverrini TaxID=6198 RepID=A0A075A7J2_OPIVI|nr:hypothetical protein T265_02138 [Opisthorchis viverrini]KER31625.1 hypothetical protein T265_02138 [Opisthorchis viverrini]